MKRRNFLSAAIGVLCAPLVAIGVMRKRVTVAGYIPIVPFDVGQKKWALIDYDLKTKVVTFGSFTIDEIKAVAVGSPPRWRVTITGPRYRHEFDAKTIVFPEGLAEHIAEAARKRHETP